MKKLLLLILLSLGFALFNSEKANAQFLDYEPISAVANKKLSDGWYNVTVAYINPQTGYKTKYTLKVKVQFNRVVTIDFGNEGSVHTGMNSSGYHYIGGDLKYENDSNGDIVSASAQVNIVDSTVSTRQFYISF